MPVPIRDSPLPSRLSFSVISISLLLRDTCASRCLFKSHPSVESALSLSMARLQEAVQDFQKLIILFGQANADSEEVCQHGIAADVAHENALRVERLKHLSGTACGLEGNEVRLGRIGRDIVHLPQSGQEPLALLNQQSDARLQQRKVLEGSFSRCHGINIEIVGQFGLGDLLHECRMTQQVSDAKARHGHGFGKSAQDYQMFKLVK